MDEATIAGAASRIRVQTEVLLAPLRDPVLLAKQSATLDRMSGGRFTLGLGIGVVRTTTWPLASTSVVAAAGSTGRWR
jgi:alkanesulfonate monooxygenase SsuD/methylene tetrahydromethanopterin reductase-like flavin-dependent oxidoreductase (luciferase family)